MPAGRPTKISEELIEKAKCYMEGDYKTIPSIAGLSVYLGVSRSTVYKWKDENDGFSDMLEQLLAIQEDLLLGNGLSGDFNATITKLVLSKHGYSDKQEIEQTTNFAVVSDEVTEEEWENKHG